MYHEPDTRFRVRSCPRAPPRGRLGTRGRRVASARWPNVPSRVRSRPRLAVRSAFAPSSAVARACLHSGSGRRRVALAPHPLPSAFLPSHAVVTACQHSGGGRRVVLAQRSFSSALASSVGRRPALPTECVRALVRPDEGGAILANGVWRRFTRTAYVPECVRVLERRREGVSTLGKRATPCGTRPGFIPECARAPNGPARAQRRSGTGAASTGSLNVRSRVRLRPRLVFPSAFAPSNAVVRACLHSGRGRRRVALAPHSLPSALAPSHDPRRAQRHSGTGATPAQTPHPYDNKPSRSRCFARPAPSGAETQGTPAAEWSSTDVRPPARTASVGVRRRIATPATDPGCSAVNCV